MKIGLALAVLAVLLAGLLMFWSTRDGSGVANAAEEVDFGPLIARIEALEAQNAELQRKLGGTKLEPPPSAREPASSSANEDLAARVLALETQLAELRERASASSPGAFGTLPPRTDTETAATLDELTRRARDVRATDEQRLSALRNLRGKFLPDGTDARLPVLDDMIALAQTSTDAETRTDVWRQLNHITDPRLKRALLDSLAFEKDGKARAKACDTMKDFLPDAQLEAALRLALANDPSPDVKAQATRLLGGH